MKVSLTGLQDQRRRDGTQPQQLSNKVVLFFENLMLNYNFIYKLYQRRILSGLHHTWKGMSCHELGYLATELNVEEIILFRRKVYVFFQFQVYVN